MYWANFLHIYQPPTQTREILTKVALESYRPLIKILKKHRSAKITLNINACLTEQLIQGGFEDVIEGIGQLAQEGRVELTGSAKYHPILPLIPSGEMERQIELNQKTNEHYFKGVYQPKGFFSPEMCYSQEMARVVKSMGFQWIVIDEIAYNGKLRKYDNDRLYFIESALPLKVFFKERKVSSAITFGHCQTKAEFEDLNRDILFQEVYLVTGTDGEVYGHHRPGQENLLIEAFQDRRIETTTISELGQIFKKAQLIEPINSSWSTWEDEIQQRMAYPQWNDPSNEIHQRQWELANLVIEEIDKTKISHGSTANWQKARGLLDEGLHSCQWWWASCRPWWDTEMPKRGTDILIQAIFYLTEFDLEDRVLQRAHLLKESIYAQLTEWQNTGKARHLQEEYRKTHPEVSSLLSFG